MTFFLHSAAADLACLRQEFGLTRETLADLIGVTTQTVEQWEQGLASMPEGIWDTFKHLAQAQADNANFSPARPNCTQ